MPTAYKCSRCTKYYDDRPEMQLQIIAPDDKYGIHLDLCSTCGRDFEAFYNNKDVMGNYIHPVKSKDIDL